MRCLKRQVLVVLRDIYKRTQGAMLYLCQKTGAILRRAGAVESQVMGGAN